MGERWRGEGLRGGGGGFLLCKIREDSPLVQKYVGVQGFRCATVDKGSTHLWLNREEVEGVEGEGCREGGREGCMGGGGSIVLL